MGKERGCPISSNVELEAKIEAKLFASSNEEDMTPESFKIMGTDDLALFRIRADILQKSRDPICLFSIWPGPLVHS